MPGAIISTPEDVGNTKCSHFSQYFLFFVIGIFIVGMMIYLLLIEFGAINLEGAVCKANTFILGRLLFVQLMFVIGFAGSYTLFRERNK